MEDQTGEENQLNIMWKIKLAKVHFCNLSGALWEGFLEPTDFSLQLNSSYFQSKPIMVEYSSYVDKILQNLLCNWVLHCPGVHSDSSKNWTETGNEASRKKMRYAKEDNSLIMRMMEIC